MNVGQSLGQMARQGVDRRQAEEFKNRLAAPLKEGDYEAAANVAFESGRPEEGLNFRAYAQDQARKDAEAARQANEALRNDYSTVVDTFGRLDLLRERGVFESDEQYQEALTNAVQNLKPIVQGNPQLAEMIPGILQKVNTAPPGAMAAYSKTYGDMLAESADPLKKAEVDIKRSTLALDKQKFAQNVREFEEKLKENKEPEPADFKDVQALRKEWSSVTDEFQGINRNINNINTLASRKDSAGDLALVVAFTKLLDPGSVAREGEVNLTKSAESAIGKARTMIPRLQKGQTLLDDQTRAQLVEAANDLASQYQGAYKNRQGEYGRIANRFFPGEDPSLILVGAGDPMAAQPGAAATMPTGFTADQGGGNIGAPIDTTRPRLENPDGSFSTEETITIDMDGRFFNIPTIVNGRRISEDEAIRLFEQGQNQPVGEFGSLREATRAARARTNEIGRVRGAPPLRGGGPPPGFELD